MLALTSEFFIGKYFKVFKIFADIFPDNMLSLLRFYMLQIDMEFSLTGSLSNLRLF